MMKQFMDAIKQRLRSWKSSLTGNKQATTKDAKVTNPAATAVVSSPLQAAALPSAPQVKATTPAAPAPAPAALTPATPAPTPTPPAPANPIPIPAAPAAPTLPLALVNRTTSNDVYVYITGLANNQWFLLQSDGVTPYYPTSPTVEGAPLQANCNIKLGAPGSTTTVTIPPISGGRIFVSIGAPLTFVLNPGPALVEPSVTNSADPNINTQWDFCELTFEYNSTNASKTLYANITYVDFLSIPISLALENSSGAVSTVTGMKASGLDTVCTNLIAQTAIDKVAGWSNLIVKQNGENLRVLSPNSSLGNRPTDFANYWEPYVSQVWQKYTAPNGSTLAINSFDGSIKTTGTVNSDGDLAIGNETFVKPSTADIFSANTGPFATGSDSVRNNLIPQIAAAFNRSTLLMDTTTPGNSTEFYKTLVTNHYCRIVHGANVDGKGYAFAYDDLTPRDGLDQSGYVNDPAPKLLTVTFGGAQNGS